MMTQGECAKSVWKVCQLTLEKFGEQIGLKKNTMSAIETGRNSLTEANVLSICREFGVNEVWPEIKWDVILCSLRWMRMTAIPLILESSVKQKTKWQEIC